MTMGDAVSSGTGGAPNRRTVSAFFDERAVAQAAVDDLVGAGIPQADIALVEGGADPVEAEAVPTQDKSVWDRVKDLFIHDDDRPAYGEGLRRGGVLLSVTTDPGHHDRVVALLDRDGAVDLDQRRDAWELEGWDPVRAAADLRSPGGATQDPAGKSVSPTRDATPGSSRVRIYDGPPSRDVP